MNKLDKIFSFVLFGFLVLCVSCATTKTPILSFSEYILEPGPSQVQKASGIEITLKAIKISEVYNYPNFFSFRLDQLPERYRKDSAIQSTYKPDSDGRSWEYPFSTPDGKLQLFFCFCKVQNNTKHILRMGDSRIYFIVEGFDPIPAISSLDELLDQADYFEAATNAQRAKEKFLIFQLPPLPEGIFQIIVRINRKAYKLINDLKNEILPGFSYEGVLAFPAAPSLDAPAKISFFDVTIKTDKAGNPIEKIQIDFNLKSQIVKMYYDMNQKKWVAGNPPESSDDLALEESTQNKPINQNEKQNIQNKQNRSDDPSQILIVITNTANIRQEPSLKGQILMTVKRGAQLKLIGIDREWLEIVIEDSTGLVRGYIHKTLVEYKK